jgi:hypothetical protein
MLVPGRLTETPGALDAALGRRCVGADPIDVELVSDLTNVIERCTVRARVAYDIE